MAKGAPWRCNLTRQRSLLLESVLLGVVGAFAAGLFEGLVEGVQHLFVGVFGGLQEGGPWTVPLATTTGGLLTGFLVYTFCPEAEGHGTDSLVKAWHRAAGRIRARVPLVKTLASALTIGSGGSAGREGPTALIAGGVASLYAGWTGRSPRETRLLLLAGAAAGLAAIFRSPVGAAFFVVEVLYFTMDVEAKALLYCMLASVVAYAVNGHVFGWDPLFRVPQGLPMNTPEDYLLFALLGLSAGAVGAVVPTVFYGLRDLFRAMPLPNHLKPALGGLLLGLMVAGLGLPELLGGGYQAMQHAIEGRLGLELMATLLVLKLLALSFTISSGGSGGVFAPVLFLGAMLGGVFAHVCAKESAPFVVVGMAALFGGAARVPMATMLMVTEMTAGYHLLVAAALAVMLSFLTQRSLTRRLRYGSLYEAQVADRLDSPAHLEETLRMALHLLGHPEATLPTPLDGETGVELPGGGRLRLVAAGEGSPRLLLRDGQLEPVPPGYAPRPGDLWLVLEKLEGSSSPG